MSAMQKTIEIDPNDFAICYELGKKEYDIIKQNLKIEDADLHLAIEIFIDCKARYPKAVNYFKMAIKNAQTNDNLSKPREKLWRLYFKFTNYNAAICQLTNIIKSDRPAMIHHFYRSLAYFALGHNDDALLDLQIIAQLNVPDKYVSRLQEDKEALFYAINHFPDKSSKINMLFQALFDNTFWGRIFYYQRGHNPCSLYKGILRQIVAELASCSNIKKSIINNELSVNLLASLCLGQRKELSTQLIKVSAGLAAQLGIVETAATVAAVI